MISAVERTNDFQYREELNSVHERCPENGIMVATGDMNASSDSIFLRNVMGKQSLTSRGLWLSVAPIAFPYSTSVVGSGKIMILKNVAKNARSSS